MVPYKKDEEKEEEEEDGDILSLKYVTYLNQLSVSWSSYSASRMLNEKLISYIRPRFHRCSTPLKVRILTSLLYLSPDFVSRCRIDLTYLLHNCETDRDDWVRRLSRIIQLFISTGYIDVREIDTETAYRIIKHLDERKGSTGKCLHWKKRLDNAKIFDVTEDFYTLNIEYTFSKKSPAKQEKSENYAEPVPPDEKGPLRKEDVKKKSEKIGNMNSQYNPVCFIRELSKIPAYEADNSCFRHGMDFSSLMDDILRTGKSIMLKELKLLESNRDAKFRRSKTKP